MRSNEAERRAKRYSILQQGTRLKQGRHIWCSQGRGPKGRIKFSREDSTTIRFLSRQQIDDLLSDGRAEILPPSLTDQVGVHAQRTLTDLSVVSKQERAKTRRRAAYVRAVLKQALKGMSEVSLTPLIKSTAEVLEDPAPPNWRTVVDWVKQYRTTDSIIGLVDQRVGNSKPRFCRALRDAIEVTVAKHYLTMKRLSQRATHGKLKLAVADANEYLSPNHQMKVPSLKALRHYISSLDGFDVLAQRWGYQFAKRHYRAYKLGVQPQRALEIVEIDSTVLDCRAVFKGVMILGRPTLTIAICRRTRCVLYAGLSFEPAGYKTVMECLVGIILGRGNLLKELNLPPDSWPMKGIPVLIRVDNGKEYRSSHLENACALLEMDIEFCPPRQPWFKGVVEREIGTLNTCIVQALPGHAYPLKARDGDSKAEDFGLLDIDDLQKIIVKWITTVYHETTHPVLEVPPRVAWEECTKDDPPFCRFTDDEVRVYCGRLLRRAVSSKGIEIDGLLYNSDELAAVRRHIQHLKDHPQDYDLNGLDELFEDDEEKTGGGGDGKIPVKLPGGVDFIYVLDPIGRRYIRVPAIAEKYTRNLSRRRHRLNMSRAKQIADQYVREADLLKAHREIDRLIAEASLRSAELLGLNLARATTPDTANTLLMNSDVPPEESIEVSTVTEGDEGSTSPPDVVLSEDLLSQLAALSRNYTSGDQK